MQTQKVKFVLAADIVANASNGLLLGEFNNWDLENGFSLKKAKDGSMTATVDLESGRSYQYRYLLEGGRWENDQNAHGYSSVEAFDTVNCIVHVPAAAVKESKPKAVKAEPAKAPKAKPAGKKVTVPATEKKAPAKAEKKPAPKKKAVSKKEK
jgi:1,4-alpha-glucan branching enzyme